MQRLGGQFLEIPENRRCSMGFHLVIHRHGEIEGIGELRLEFGLLGMTPTTITATGVRENEELAWVRGGTGESLDQHS
jgi:hypothetical protein